MILNEKKRALVLGLTTLIAVGVIITFLFSNQKDNYKTKEQLVALQDFIIAESASGDYTVRLIMTDGEYFDIEHTSPGGGICEENYSGNYRLDVLKDKKLVSSADIGAMLFGKKFKLMFDDYNGDEKPDFSIGQWAGSNYNEFTLYSIDADGNITEIGNILTSEGKNEEDYSMLFSHENKVITTQVYDQEQGKSVTAFYGWNTEAKSFVQQK